MYRRRRRRIDLWILYRLIYRLRHLSWLDHLLRIIVSHRVHRPLCRRVQVGISRDSLSVFGWNVWKIGKKRHLINELHCIKLTTDCRTFVLTSRNEFADSRLTLVVIAFESSDFKKISAMYVEDTFSKNCCTDNEKLGLAGAYNRRWWSI
jgi:hypothetical protein